MIAKLNPESLTAEERLDHLERQLAATQLQLAEVLRALNELTAKSARGGSSAETDGSISAQIDSFVSRRSMLKKAAMATLGAAAVLETMPSARAAAEGTQGGDLILGENNDASGSTVVTASGDYIGLVGSSTSGVGVNGRSTSGSGVYGTSGSGHGVDGRSVSNTAVHGQSDSGYGVYGEGYYGAGLKGSVAPLYLNASDLYSPYIDTNGHYSGELFVDQYGGLWYCVVGGTPGTWRKLADSGTAGSYASFSEPIRFIDTRSGSESPSATGASAPPPGASAAMPYILSGADAVQPYFPYQGIPPMIPYGATSVVGRLTVLNGMNGHSTTKGGLKLSSQNPPSFGSGLISWGSTPSIQATSFVLPLAYPSSESPSAYIYALNTSVADEIDILIDISGYYY